MISKLFKESKINIWCFGILFIHNWNFCSQRTLLAQHAYFSVSATLFTALSIALILFALYTYVTKTNIETVGLFSGAMLTMSILGSILLTFDFGLDNLPIQLRAGSIMVGVGNAWLYLIWFNYLYKYHVKDCMLIIFISMGVGTILKAIITFMPASLSGIVISSLPALAYVCLIRAKANANTDHLYNERFTTERLFELKYIGASVALFGLSLGLLQAARPLEFFLDTGLLVIIWHIFELCVALLILWYTLYLKAEPTFGQLWRFIIFITASGYVAYIALPEMFAEFAMILTSTAQTSLVMLLYVALCDIANKTQIKSGLIFCMGWLAYTLTLSIGAWVIYFANPFVGYEQIVSINIFLMMISLAFLISDSQPAQLEIMNGLRTYVSSESVSNLKYKVDELRIAYKLTQREAEILELFASGRTRSYIASSLYISENTVKGHLAKIYSKLDIHSKQELINLFINNR